MRSYFSLDYISQGVWGDVSCRIRRTHKNDHAALFGHGLKIEVFSMRLNCWETAPEVIPPQVLNEKRRKVAGSQMSQDVVGHVSPQIVPENRRSVAPALYLDPG